MKMNRQNTEGLLQKVIHPMRTPLFEKSDFVCRFLQKIKADYLVIPNNFTLSLSLRYLHAIASHVSYSFFVFYQTSASSFIGTCKAFLCIIKENPLAMPLLLDGITAFPLSP